MKAPVADAARKGASRSGTARLSRDRRVLPLVRRESRGSIDDACRYAKLSTNDRRRHIAVPELRRKNMGSPEGKLTPAQFEIMQLIWNSAAGLTIGEIWDAVRTNRNVSRTTVLNLVDRLDKRNWLKRRKDQGVYRYVTCVERPTAEEQLAVEFVEEFFQGSASNLVMSLLGSKRISKADVESLKRLLGNADADRSRQEKGTR
jgi:predicted transcriptional regulator